jgi:hypothetical protein
MCVADTEPLSTSISVQKTALLELEYSMDQHETTHAIGYLQHTRSPNSIRFMTHCVCVCVCVCVIPFLCHFHGNL